MSLRPGEILDFQGDLLERLVDPAFKNYLSSMLRLSRIQEPDMAIGALRAAVQTADAYRVSPDMSMLVQHAADSLNEEDLFDRDHGPGGAGFVAFDRPVPISDARGETMLMHYLIWGPAAFLNRKGETHHGVAGYGFNDILREPDQSWADTLARGQKDGTLPEGMSQETFGDAFENARKTIGRWGTIGVLLGIDGSSIGPGLVDPDEEQRADILADGIEPTSGSNMLRLMYALWLLMGQTIAVAHPEIPDRHARRRAQKRNIPQGITVIKLRREEAHREPGETNVEWAHRWLVRGHWRWQVCGERHPLAQEIQPGKWRCRIWIHSFEKGPEGAPLIQTRKVYSLER